MTRWPVQTLARGALQVAQRVAAVLNCALGKLDGDVALDFELVGVEGNVATGVIVGARREQSGWGQGALGGWLT